MMGPPKDTNLDLKSQELPSMDTTAELNVSGAVENKPRLHLVTKEDIEVKKKKNEQEAQHLEVIRKIDQKLLNSDLTKIRVVDIKTLCETEYDYICSNIRNEENQKVDWQYVKDRLSEENQIRFPLRKFRNLEIAIKELRENLLRDKPATFSSIYVETNYPNIFSYLLRDAKKANRKIDWNFIVQGLKDLECKFIPEHVHIEKEEAIGLLVGILRETKKEVSVEDIARINSPLYVHFRNHYNGGYGYINWEEIKNSLPLDLKDKLKLPKDYFKRKYIAQLNEYILQNEQEIITPNGLLKSCKRIFNKIAVLFRDINGDIDWRQVKNRLSLEARQKFKFNRTRVTALHELNELLIEKNPQKINSRYIKQLNPNLFSFLAANFRNLKGNIDWKYIVNHLRKDLREKFEYPVRYHNSLPEEEYEDEKEVEESLREMKKYLYTFLQASTGEEYDKRNEICHKLIYLAKKGNKAAEEELMNYISFLTEKWILQIPQFNVWKFHNNEQYEIMHRCIYNYKNKGPFVGYVYKSLQSAASGLEHFKEIALE